MKVKLELDEKKYEGEVEEVEKIEDYLIQAENEPEVFVVLDRVKHWIQNPETAKELNYDIYKREILSLDRVNYFITGDTFNTIGEPERARDIYYPEENNEPPIVEGGGILSLSILPTTEEWNYCGFNYHILFGKPNYSYLDFIKTTGATVIPFCNNGSNDPWSDESHVAGYYMADNTPYDVGAVKGWYNSMKAKTSKPVGSIFWRPPNETDMTKLISISETLDFILLYAYPYIEGYSLEKTNGIIEYVISTVKKLKCPVMVGAQGFSDLDGFKVFVNPGEVGVRNQYEQYHNAGISVWWYSWTDHHADVKRNFQYLMHEFNK